MIHALENERVETITPDRGKEFAEHGAVTKHLGGKQFYFPLPHHPWQRGTNENTNGLLREYFPKRKDITNYSDEYIAAVTDKINKRPRKCLGYKTPFEVYYSKTLHLI
ncbi:MAG: IS30 family transposase [Treponema sp.]|nr:IS30 family transposase [Treponema sp.]